MGSVMFLLHVCGAVLLKHLLGSIFINFLHKIWRWIETHGKGRVDKNIRLKKKQIQRIRDKQIYARDQLACESI